MPSDTPDLQGVPYQLSTMENIDRAVFEYIDGTLSLHAETNEGWKKVPVIWVSAERAFQIKKPEASPAEDGTIRDARGALVLPIMSVERTSVIKDPASKGTAWGNIPKTADFQGGSITIARRIQQDKTANFANADSFKAGSTSPTRKQVNFRTRKRNSKVVYETISVPMPVYIDITYSILLKTEYQEQMNQLLSPFITKPGGVNYIPLKRNGHFYEAFMKPDMSQNNNISTLEEEERKYETKIEFKVLGYLQGDGINEIYPKTVTRENAVQIRMPRERIMTDEDC